MIAKFDREPEFPELWEMCLNNLMYDRKKYVQEVVGLFGNVGVGKSFRILDTCSGTGFISLDLRALGFDVDCMNLSGDEIEFFRKRAREFGVSGDVRQLSWKKIPEIYSPKTYDFLFCRGNSFIYANGGWEKDGDVSEKSSIRAYEETLKNFYDILRPGGYLYIDKFRDDEVLGRELIGEVEVGGNSEDLYFCTERDLIERQRRAQMVREGKGYKKEIFKKTFDLGEGELEGLIKKVGFRTVRRLDLKSEKHFTVWLAQK